VDFVLATQPKEWKKLEQHHGAAVREQFLKRLVAEIERRGALDVLRGGLKDSGCKFRLAYYRPASGLNEETRRLHAANLFAVVRQVHYSTGTEKTRSCQEVWKRNQAALRLFFDLTPLV
jgi:type I restriction enzyme R subunit